MGAAHDILGVSEQASAKEITAAYRRLAMRWHPDRCGGDEAATRRFQEIEEAYRMLQGSLTSSAAAKPFTRTSPPAKTNDDRAPDFGGEVPWRSVLFVVAGVAGWWFSDNIKIGVGAFSGGLLLAYHYHRFGAGFWSYWLGSVFRLAVRLYFVALLAWVVFILGKTALQ